MNYAPSHYLSCQLKTAESDHRQFTKISCHKELGSPIPILSPDLTWKERSCSTFGPVYIQKSVSEYLIVWLAHRRISSRKMFNLKFTAFRPRCWGNTCFRWLFFMFDFEITLNTFETRNDQLLSSSSSWYVILQHPPVRLHFKFIIVSDKPQYQSAEIEGHIQWEAYVCRTYGSANQEVWSQSCRKCGTKNVNTYANPSVKVIRSPWDFDVVINLFH